MEQVTCVPLSLSPGHKPPLDYEEIPKIRCLHFGVSMCVYAAECVHSLLYRQSPGCVCLSAVCASAAISTP